MTGTTPTGERVTGELVTMPNGDHYIKVVNDVTELWYYVESTDGNGQELTETEQSE